MRFRAIHRPPPPLPLPPGIAGQPAFNPPAAANSVPEITVPAGPAAAAGLVRPHGGRPASRAAASRHGHPPTTPSRRRW
ncbi:MAG: hypothetical protein WDN72_00070 [Alphaproteobacteria bacterium]